MITDPVPRGAKKNEYERSDALLRMPLPPAEELQAYTRQMAELLADGKTGPVREAAGKLLGLLSQFYEVPAPGVRVLGVRPHRVTRGVCTYQLFGDYTPSTQQIRVWMRTAMREQVTSPRALLNTLLHEFCHHLDCHRLSCPQSYHTRGFFTRIDHLYHHALGTPRDARRPLRWIWRGTRWTIDWRELRAKRQ